MFLLSFFFFFCLFTQKLCLLELVSLLTHFHTRAFSIIDMNVKIHVVIHCTYVLMNMYSERQKKLHTKDNILIITKHNFYHISWGPEKIWQDFEIFCDFSYFFFSILNPGNETILKYKIFVLMYSFFWHSLYVCNHVHFFFCFVHI